MRHYEIVIIIYPNSDIYINDIIEYYTNLVNKNGILYRLENWGLRDLAYNIKKNSKAYYILMNIKVNIKIINFISDNLKLNKNVLRFLIIKKKKAESSSSCIINKNNNN